MQNLRKSLKSSKCVKKVFSGFSNGHEFQFAKLEKQRDIVCVGKQNKSLCGWVGVQIFHDRHMENLNSLTEIRGFVDLEVNTC